MAKFTIFLVFLLLIFPVSVFGLSDPGEHISTLAISNAGPALERLPDFSTWALCAEVEQPWFFHRRLRNQALNVYWLASAFYADKASRQPTFAAVIRAEVRIGRPSDVVGEIYSFVRQEADPVLAAFDPLRGTDGVSVTIWPPDSELAKRFVA